MCAKHAHARDVERLPRHVYRAHVHDAFKTEVRGDSGGSDSMLARARFRDDARLAHFHREQSLADGIIDFVRSRVEQIFSLEINARAAEFFSEAGSELQRRRAASEILQKILEVRLKRRIGLRSFVRALELEERHHQGFGDVTAAVRAEASWRRRR